ncbi:MAG: ABC transporter ATP-binding protein [Desulfobacteraceae bacterium]|nr:MAG: ABC transporter ATP-binding protein [Desulfobacteraceae bacterium]
MTSANETLLSVDDLRIHFHGEGPVSLAVDGIDVTVGPRETVCIVGESGCGKTITALAIMGLLPQPPAQIAGGRIFFKGQSLLDKSEGELRKLRGREIAMIFQEPMTSLNPVFTIADQISEAILAHEDISESEALQRTTQLLQDVGIPDPEKRRNAYPHQLSGGQRQRAMIAMALACGPDLIIADEPTTALDVTVQAQILNLLRDLQRKRHMAIQYITHDLGVVSAIADRVYVMYAGLIAEEGTTAHIFQSPRHPYTRALLESLPSREKRGQRLYSIPGNVPHPAYKPQGCPFHPRCKYRQAKCPQFFPTLCDYGEGHRARCPILFETEGPAGKTCEWKNL